MAALSRKKGTRGSSGPDQSDPAVVSSPSQSSISADHLLILNRIHAATRGPYDVQELLELLVNEIKGSLDSLAGVEPPVVFSPLTLLDPDGLEKSFRAAGIHGRNYMQNFTLFRANSIPSTGISSREGACHIVSLADSLSKVPTGEIGEICSHR